MGYGNLDATEFYAGVNFAACSSNPVYHQEKEETKYKLKSKYEIFYI